ncbi:hypothetical protein VDBG_09224, partial [Verticillium alfalfae VaMs.102]
FHTNKEQQAPACDNLCSTQVVQTSVNRTRQVLDDGTYTHRLHHCYSLDWLNHHSSPRVYFAIVSSEKFSKKNQRSHGYSFYERLLSRIHCGQSYTPQLAATRLSISTTGTPTQIGDGTYILQHLSSRRYRHGCS